MYRDLQGSRSTVRLDSVKPPSVGRPESRLLCDAIDADGCRYGPARSRRLAPNLPRDEVLREAAPLVERLRFQPAIQLLR